MRSTLYSVAASATLLISLCAGCDQRLSLGPAADAAETIALRQKLQAGGSTAAVADTGPSQESTGWATLHGAFKVKGSVALAARISADKDVEVCGKHPLFDETVVVNSGGGLQNVVVFCRTKKPQIHPDYEQSANGEVVLDNKNCRFEPHVVAMRTSQKLVVKNSDPVGHNTKLDAVSNPPFNVLIPSNSAQDQSLPSEEALPAKVGCNIHPWMGGWVVVRNDPYATVTDVNGNFELKNVPAGRELEFQIWHEKKNGPLPGLTVSGVKVDAKGRFKLKLEPDQELSLAFEVQADALR